MTYKADIKRFKRLICLSNVLILARERKWLKIGLNGFKSNECSIGMPQLADIKCYSLLGTMFLKVMELKI